MKIEAVALRNFMGFEDVEVPFEKPIVILVGPNESGKTTLGRDGPRWVLTNDARGIRAKDVRSLVRRGADTMRAAVSVTRGEANLVVQRTPSASVPATLAAIHNFLGARTGDAVALAFDAGGFLDLDTEKRKAALFALAGVVVDRTLFVEAGLVRAGSPGPNEDLVDLAIRRGFGPARTEATERRRAASRRLAELASVAPEDSTVDWTGQTKAQAHDVSPLAALAWVADLDRWIARTEGELGRTENADVIAKTRESHASAKETAGKRLREAEVLVNLSKTGITELEKPEALAALATSVGSSEADLRDKSAAYVTASGAYDTAREEVIRAEAARDSARRALSDMEELAAADRDRECDHVCLEHPKSGHDTDAAAMALRAADGVLARAEAARNAALSGRDEAQTRRDGARRMHDDAAKRKAAHEDSIRSSKARLSAAEEDARRAAAWKREAEEAAARFEAGLPVVDPGHVEHMRGELVKARAALEKARKTEEIVRTYHSARVAFERDEKERLGLIAKSEDAGRYEAAFAPGGLVGSLVAAPLERLREVVSRFSGLAGLRGGVQIHDDLSITYDGADVALASASAYWRLAAAFAVALGAVSGLRFAVLDEVSVVVGPARDALLDALRALAGEFDQVIVTGAEETKPAAKDRGVVRLVWIDSFRAEVLE